MAQKKLTPYLREQRPRKPRTYRTTKKIRGEARTVQITKTRKNRSGRTQKIIDRKRNTRTESRYKIRKEDEKTPAKQEYEKDLIRKRLANVGIDPQTVDIDGLYDPKLTYTENIRNPETFGKLITENKPPSQHQIYLDKQKELREVSRERPSRSWKRDEARTHKKTVAITKMDVEDEYKWRREPGKFDIRTVDDRLAYHERKKDEERKKQQAQARKDAKEFHRELVKRYPPNSQVTRQELNRHYSDQEIQYMKNRGLIGERRKNREYVIL